MSYETRMTGSKDQNSSVTHHRTMHSISGGKHTSSMVINIRQLQTELQTQHQHEKHALNELNQRFHLFVDRVHQLEAQHSKYLTELSGFARPWSGDSAVDAQFNERYLHVQSDLTAAHNARAAGEADFEYFQLQIGIYQQLLEGEQHWKDKRLGKLNHELKQLGSDLVVLRTSYADLERIVESHYAEREDMFKQYLTVTHDWCNMKKQRKKWLVSIETLKSFIGFYKNIRSYQSREFNVTVRSDDIAHFWALELDKSVKRIRHDFELFYATVYRELTAYYETKMEEVKTEVEQAVTYQQSEWEEISMSTQTLSAEYEKVEHTLSYEKESFLKLEATCSKLESEFRSMQLYYQEQREAQARELHSSRESIMMMAYDIDEIRRSKVNLEAEIIVYRYLLDSVDIGGVAVTSRTHTSGNELAGKFVAKRQKKGRVGIKECDVNGVYITLVNHSTSKDIDLSRWVVKRRIDSTADIRYTIPDGVRLQREGELRIYSRLGAHESTEFSGDHSHAAWSQQRLVNNDLPSWGVGNTIETYLFNQHGEEEASYTQSIALRRNNTYEDY